MTYHRPVHACCKGCPDRWVTSTSRCHSVCPRYAEYRRLLEQNKIDLDESRIRMGYDADKYIANKVAQIREHYAKRTNHFRSVKKEL